MTTKPVLSGQVTAGQVSELPGTSRSPSLCRGLQLQWLQSFSSPASRSQLGVSLYLPPAWSLGSAAGETAGLLGSSRGVPMALRAHTALHLHMVFQTQQHGRVFQSPLWTSFPPVFPFKCFGHLAGPRRHDHVRPL